MSAEEYKNEEILENNEAAAKEELLEHNEEITKEETLDDSELEQIAAGISIGAVNASNAYYTNYTRNKPTDRDVALSGMLNSNTNAFSSKLETAKKGTNTNTNRVQATDSSQQGNNDNNNQSGNRRFLGWG